MHSPQELQFYQPFALIAIIRIHDAPVQKPKRGCLVFGVCWTVDSCAVALCSSCNPSYIVHSDEELDEGSMGEGGARGSSLTLGGDGGSAFPDRVANVRGPREARRGWWSRGFPGQLSATLN